MAGIALGSDEAREVLKQDFVKRMGNLPSNRAFNVDENGRPIDYLPAWWEGAENALVKEEDDWNE